MPVDEHALEAVAAAHRHPVALADAFGQLAVFLGSAQLGACGIGLVLRLQAHGEHAQADGGQMLVLAAAGQGQRAPSANELDGARFQGRHVAEIAGKLAK